MKGLISISLKLIVTGVLLYVVLRYLHGSKFPAELGDVDVWWLAAGILVAIFQAGLVAARWKDVLLQLRGTILPLWLAFAWNGTSTLIGQVLPSTVGGDAFRVGMLAGKSDLSSGLRAVLADRIIGLVALAVIVVAAGSQLIVMSDSPERWIPFVIGLGGCLGFLLVVLAEPHVPDGQKILSRIGFISRDMRIVLTSGRIATLSIVAHLLSIVTFGALAQALNLHTVTFLELSIVVPCALLISAVPISLGGWGLRESAMYLGFKLVDGDPAAAIVLSVMFGIVNLAVAAIGTLLWLATRTGALRTQ